MSDRSFDLIGIFHQIFRKKIFVIIVTLAALIISLVICNMQTPGYTSETVFIVKNPLMIDRNFVFRHTDYENREFFASPDDVDNVKTIAKSDGMLWYIIDSFNLRKAYHTENDGQLITMVRKNFKAVMEDTRSLELYYTDTDPQRAANITNAARDYLEKKFMDYFLVTNKDIAGALQDNTDSLKRKMNVLNDSIETIRAAIGNYSQLLPSRGTTVNAGSATTNAQGAASLEHLQEIATLKDKMAKDIADNQSLISEYEVMANKKIHIFYIIQDAYVPGAPSTPKTIIVVTASTIAGLFFASVLVLLSGFYEYVMESKRRKA
jgi:uncharacterized protein involved in exopolysaccharide biosynthesis